MKRQLLKLKLRIKKLQLIVLMRILFFILLMLGLVSLHLPEFQLIKSFMKSIIQQDSRHLIWTMSIEAVSFFTIDMIK